MLFLSLASALIVLTCCLPRRTQLPAVSTAQLKRLPEFTCNMFMERLVRIFSQTSEQLLTLYELIDLYSALHRSGQRFSDHIIVVVRCDWKFTYAALFGQETEGGMLCPRRASVTWKCCIAFCIFDFDEDGMLDAQDLYRTLRQMVR